MDIEIGKWGNSLGVRIPAALAKSLGLTEGSQVSLQAVQDQLIIKKAQPAAYSLETMLAAIDEQNLHTEIATGPMLGREAW
jgi:antitoxin MazE